MDLWDKRIVLPFLIDPDESSDKNYLPSKRLARQLLRREIEEAFNISKRKFVKVKKILFKDWIIGLACNSY